MVSGSDYVLPGKMEQTVGKLQVTGLPFKYVDSVLGKGNALQRLPNEFSCEHQDGDSFLYTFGNHHNIDWREVQTRRRIFGDLLSLSTSLHQISMAIRIVRYLRWKQPT